MLPEELIAKGAKRKLATQKTIPIPDIHDDRERQQCWIVDFSPDICWRLV